MLVNMFSNCMMKLSESINNLNAEEKQALDSLIVTRQFKKGQMVFDANAYDQYIYYVEDGLLRKYIIKDSQEKTLDFYFKDEIYFPAILEADKKTGVCLQALADTNLYILNNFQYEKIKSEHTAFLKMEIAILEAALFQTTERLTQFQTMTATERYLTLLERNPKIVQQISLTHVASYLGINNASLSKIRGKLK